MSIIVKALYLLVVSLVIVCYLIYCRVHKTKQNEVGKANNQLAIGRTEVRIGAQEVINRFYDNIIDHFLRENMGYVKYWLPVYEDRVGIKPEGIHTIRVFFIDGTSREVKVAIPKIHLLFVDESKKKTMEEKKIEEVSIDQIVREWLTRWSPKMEEYAEKCEGFSIPNVELPKENEAIDQIAACVTRQGFFNCKYDKENSCMRLAYVGLDE